jgi:hypothetical protein
MDRSTASESRTLGGVPLLLAFPRQGMRWAETRRATQRKRTV